MRIRIPFRPPAAGVAVALAPAVLAALLTVGGCGGSNPYPLGTYERGEYFLQEGDRSRAVEALDDFLRRSPTDTLAAQAQFLKAQTYMEMEEYPLAAVEFQIFRKEYPTSDLVDDAYYQEGVAYLEQVGRVERDISGAYDAREHFRRFLRLYPDSPLAGEVRLRLQEVSDLIVTKKLNAAEVYRHLGRHRAIATLMEGLLESEPQSTLLDEVLLRLARASRRIGEPERARSAYERLLADYPASPLAPEARAGLKALGAPAAAAAGGEGEEPGAGSGSGAEPAGGADRPEP